MTTYHQLYWLRYVNKKWRTPCNSCLVENTSNNRQRFGLVQVSNSNRFKKLKLKTNRIEPRNRLNCIVTKNSSSNKTGLEIFESLNC